jgi:hypothetical protein
MIIHSPTIKADLAACCLQSQIRLKSMVWDVATQWNSTLELIWHALKLWPALQLLIVMCEHNKAWGVHLKQFQLSEAEWKLPEQLHPLLNLLLDATKKISQNKIPLIHDAIQIVDILTAVMDDFIDDMSLHLTV